MREVKLVKVAPWYRFVCGRWPVDDDELDVQAVTIATGWVFSYDLYPP